MSYYGMLAHYETNQKIKIEKTDIPKMIGKNPEYTTARWLLSLNQYKDVYDFLKYKAKYFEKSAKQINRVELFYYMALAKYYLPLFSDGRQPPSKTPDRNFFNIMQISCSPLPTKKKWKLPAGCLISKKNLFTL